MQTFNSQTRNLGRCVATLVLALAGSTAVAAATADVSTASAFVQGAPYRGVPAAAPDEAQVILFRKADSHARTGADVYVDGELHAALFPNGFTRLCVRPGSHSVEAYVDDWPLYAGKNAPSTRVMLAGGTTYFVDVGDAKGALTPLHRADAEVALQAALEQRHLLSRASAVVACQGVMAAVPQAAASTAAVPAAALPVSAIAAGSAMGTPASPCVCAPQREQRPNMK